MFLHLPELSRQRRNLDEDGVNEDVGLVLIGQ
jgi:hypothetical protein